MDLELALQAQGQQASIIGRGIPIEVMKAWKPDFIWCCAGTGGPTKDHEQVMKQIDTNLGLTSELLDAFNKTTVKLCFFSTHYLNQDPHGSLSTYSATKRDMEKMCGGFPNAYIFRVGSLYGTHLPGRTFPGKIVPKLMRLDPLILPQNHVSPTPTEWLAEQLLWRFDPATKLQVISPSGSFSVYDWGVMVSDSLARGNIKKGILDESYPYHSQGMTYGCTNEADDCWRLWNRYSPKLMTSLKSHYR